MTKEQRLGMTGAFKDILKTATYTSPSHAPLPENHRSRRNRIKELMRKEKQGRLSVWRALNHIKKHRTSQYNKMLSEAAVLGRQMHTINTRENRARLLEAEELRDNNLAAEFASRFGETRAAELVAQNHAVEERNRKKHSK